MKDYYPPGAIVNLNIVEISHDGKGIGFLKKNGEPERRLPVFVSGALPSQYVASRITRNKGSYLEGELAHIHHEDEYGNFQKPICGHWQECGGCPLQRLLPFYQLNLKNDLARETLIRIGHFKPDELRDIWDRPLESPLKAAYRNKVELAFGVQNDSLALGFRKRSSHAVFNLERCALLRRTPHAIIHACRDLASLAGMKSVEQDGLLRFLTLRRAAAAADGKPEWHAILLTSPGDRRERKKITALGHALLQSCPDLKSFTHEARRKNDKLPFGERRVFCMDAAGAVKRNLPLYMQLGGRGFAQDANSFFQVNSEASELLLGVAREMDAQTSGPLLDLYCGVGAPGQLLAARHAECLGMELNEVSAAYARKNAEATGLKDWQYRAGDAAKLLAELDEDEGKWQTALIDPPRSGIDKQALAKLMRIAPQHIIYISCNPATFARDAAILRQAYNLRRVAPVDMFPHTPHLELCGFWEKSPAQPLWKGCQ